MKEEEQAISAVRSYARNLVMKPKVEERLEKARRRLESYLVLHGKTALQVGAYKVELREGELLLQPHMRLGL